MITENEKISQKRIIEEKYFNEIAILLKLLSMKKSWDSRRKVFIIYIEHTNTKSLILFEKDIELISINFTF